MAIVLVATATAAAGPLAFVPGPVPHRLVRPAPIGLLAAGFAGAILALGADLVATHPCRWRCPPGSSRAPSGAPYIVWLLASVKREGRGG